MTNQDTLDIALYLPEDRVEAIHGLADTPDSWVREYALAFSADEILDAAERVHLDLRSAVDAVLYPISYETLRSLRDEAGSHGDHEQVELCDRAILGDLDAIAACQQVIAAAEAMCAEDEIYADE